MTRSNQAGFTLLEILVSLVVFGLIIAGLGQGMQFGLRAWSQQVRTIGARGDEDAVDRALRTMVARLDPASPVAGRAHAMAFTSDLPDAAALPTREADLLLQVDPQHRLLLRWLPHLHAQRLAPPPAAKDAELLEGVERLDLAYWPQSGPGGWRDAWDERGPPALIRIRLIFAGTSPRRWPDIVAAPMRDGDAK